MKRLCNWLVYETIGFVFCIIGFIGCAYATFQIFTHLTMDDPLIHLGLGFLGVITALLGVCFLLSIAFLILVAIKVIPEDLQEQKDHEKRNGL